MAPLAGYHTAALMLGLRALGALAWQPEALSHEVAAAVSAQVSIAVARFIAMETTARMEAAREGERLRTALIDSMTHELRTPLTSIRAAATTLLESEGLDEDGRLDMARIIDEEASRLDLLIGESVEMAEIDANVVQVKMSPQHPRALLDQAVEESRKILAAHKVSISVDEQDHAGQDEPAWFDPHLLGRVLRHLLENVASYTPQGTRVTLSSKRSGDRLEFCVEDNGPGIDALDLPLIFEKFYRGKRGAKVRKGPAWAWRLPAPFWPRTAEGSRLPALPAAARAFVSGCRWWRKSQTGNKRSVGRIAIPAAVQLRIGD